MASARLLPPAAVAVAVAAAAACYLALQGPVATAAAAGQMCARQADH